MSDEKTCNCPKKLDENMFELSEEDLRHVSGGSSDAEPIGYCNDCNKTVDIEYIDGQDHCKECHGTNVYCISG